MPTATGNASNRDTKFPQTMNDAELTETVNENRDITDLNAFVFLSNLTTERENLRRRHWP